MKLIKSLIVMVCVFCGMACSDNDGESAGKPQTTKFKVAVIMPATSQERWNRTAEWALSNMTYAQSTLQTAVSLELEWKDENTADIDSYIASVSKDDSYCAIIGPFTSTKARVAAEACLKSGKTLLLPMATSAELQRMYANTQNIWNLVQSDITQCELMILQASLYEKSEVSLLAPDTEYGQSFSDWFSYQASEAGLDVGFVDIYSNTAELRSAMDKQVGTNRVYDKALLFVPGSDDDAIAFDNEYGRLKGDDDYLDFPQVICSDNMYSATLESKLKYYDYEGLAPSAAPESGFNEAYYAKFNSYPIPGEAHLFDALMMVGFAATESVKSGNGINESLLEATQWNGTWNSGWMRDDLRLTFEAIQQGREIDLGGVTGDWTFDTRTKSCVLNSTYTHWIHTCGKYSALEYVSADGGARTTSQLQAWESQSTNVQSFDSNQKNFTYPELKNNWAVVISGSTDWANYRHQADALAMYQVLKRHGYDDDHIMYISEDNIAYHAKNLHQGVVKVRPDGENLYHDVNVDYKLSELTFFDFGSIMTGDKSAGLRKVLETTENDNIFIYWCGHGTKNELAWGNSIINSTFMADIFKQMNKEKRYRKIFFALDACYSGTIGNACVGIPGIVVMTAANATEPSKADMKDTEMGIWLSNGFTRAFQETIDSRVDISLRDLYYTLSLNTVGSHATVYNMENYGNAYNNYMNEFLK
jgi:ABC-type branched-subunit amino acid transport system substrate-binding protein